MVTTTRPGISIYDRFLSAVLVRCREHSRYSIESNIEVVRSKDKLFDAYWLTHVKEDHDKFIAAVQAGLERVR